MTRINVVPVEELTTKHLVAEYRENPRVFALAHKAYTNRTKWYKGLTLERIDNLKGYSKENCEWATKSRQASNRGNSGNTSGRLGLFFDKEKNKWRVLIVVNKVKINGGRFKNKDEAIQKLNELEIKYFGATREDYV